MAHLGLSRGTLVFNNMQLVSGVELESSFELIKYFT